MIMNIISTCCSMLPIKYWVDTLLTDDNNVLKMKMKLLFENCDRVYFDADTSKQCPVLL